jgi:leader peptidase (prepilin peptidase) / N-methyltransferase
MNVMVPVLAGVFGSLVGSFLNVVIWRLPRGESIVFPASRCPGCGARLGALDLVPVLSWLALRGRCRSCGMAISARYPLVELLAAGMFVAVTLASPPLEFGLAQWVAAVGLGAALIALFFIDLDHKLLPDSITLGGLPGLLILAALGGGQGLTVDLVPALLGAGVGAGILALIAGYGAWVMSWFGREDEDVMGFGDVKLAALMGAALGWERLLVALFLGFFIGAVVGTVLRRLGGDREIPFGPFLAAGAMTALFAGDAIIAWYLGLT